MSDWTRTKVKDEKIEGHVVEFKVGDDGTWYATSAILEGEVFAKTIIECRQKVTGRLRRATMKLAVKATLVNVLPDAERERQWYSRDDTAKANMIRPITLTGISQRGGDVMYSFDDSGAKSKKKPHQGHTDPDSIGVVCRRLNAAEQGEYRKKRDAFDNSRDALDLWIKEHKIENVSEFLEAQIAAAVDKAPEPEPETEDPRIDAAAAPLRDSRKDRAKKLKRNISK